MRKLIRAITNLNEGAHLSWFDVFTQALTGMLAGFIVAIPLSTIAALLIMLLGALGTGTGVTIYVAYVAVALIAFCSTAFSVILGANVALENYRKSLRHGGF